MSHNINQIQYLIGQFNSLINAFGQKPEQVKYFKEQSQGIVNLGQLQQNDLDFVYKVLGIQNTSNVKWSITMPKLQKFIEAMNYMVSCDTDTQRQRCLMQLLRDKKIENTVADLVDELYNNRLFGGNFDINSLKSNKFGTFGIVNASSQIKKSKNNQTKQHNKKISINTNSKESLVNILVDAKIEAISNNRSIINSIAYSLDSVGLGVIAFVLLDDAKNYRKIHIKNYEAACSCDPRYYDISIKDLLELSIKYTDTYKLNLLKAIERKEFYINEHIESFGESFALKQSTENWLRLNTRELKFVIEILLDASKKINQSSN